MTSNSIFKHILKFSTAIGLMMLLASGNFAGAQSINETVEQVTVTEHGLNIKWKASEINWSRSNGSLVPELKEYLNDNRPGYFQLPYRSVTFAIPAGHEVAITQNLGDQIAQRQPVNLSIAPEPGGLELNSQGEIIGGRFSATSTIGASPSTHITVEEIGVMGGVRLGKATFNPLIVQNGALRFVDDGALSITFNQTSPMSGPGGVKPPKSVLQSLRSVVVNPQHMVADKESVQGAGPTSADAVLYVRGDGIVQVTQQMLSNNGVDISSINPQELRISHMGTTLPILWLGDGDLMFEAGESFLFYAPPSQSRWSQTPPFLIQSDGAASPTMSSRPGSPNSPTATAQYTQKVVVEENHLYSADCLCGTLPAGWDGDRWVWGEMRRPGNAIGTFDFDLSQVDTTQPSSMTIHLIGFTEQAAAPDHRVQVNLNSSLIGTVEWDGVQAHSKTFTLPAGGLQATNELSLELIEGLGAIDGVWLDAVEFEFVPANPDSTGQIQLVGSDIPGTYAIPNSSGPLTIFDVTDKSSPHLLSSPLTVDPPVGSPPNTPSTIFWDDETTSQAIYQIVNRYLEPETILPSSGLIAAPSTGATYIMIAPAEFASSDDLHALKHHREELGWNVVIETAEEIYTAFGNGTPSPIAIKSYLSWAYHQWDTQPEMVLLVGDGSNDPKLYNPNSTSSKIPPFLADVDPWIGESASDNRFVTVDGTDTLPDMIIGRFPVNSTSELATVVNKIINYETTKPVGDWNRNMLIISDNNDDGGDFVGSSTYLVETYLNEPWNPHTLFFGIDINDEEEARNNILRSWKQGQGMIMYTGHSSIHQWGSEQLIHIDKTSELDNGNNLPLVMQMTCFTGSFHSSSFNTLDEQLVREDGGGAIATWGATGLGLATGHSSLASGAFNSLYVNQNRTLGVATMAGKAKLAADQPAYQDLIDTFVLLGDPALQIGLDLTGQTINLPIITR